MSDALERPPLELVAFAAWVNCPVDKIPAEYREPTCVHTMASWKRVADVILATRHPDPQVTALVEAAQEALADSARRYAAYGPAGIPMSGSVSSSLRAALAAFGSKAND